MEGGIHAHFRNPFLCPQMHYSECVRVCEFESRQCKVRLWPCLRSVLLSGRERVEPREPHGNFYTLWSLSLSLAPSLQLQSKFPRDREKS